MTKLCQCSKTATRDTVTRNNNICDECGENIREFENITSNSEYRNVDNITSSSEESSKYSENKIPLYENSPTCNFNLSPFDDHTYENWPEIPDLILNNKVCHCETPQISGPYCSNCGDQSVLNPLVKLHIDDSEQKFSDPNLHSLQNFDSQKDHIFGSVQRRPRFRNTLFGSSHDTEETTYTRISGFQQNRQEIDPALLQNFAQEYNLAEDLILQIQDIYHSPVDNNLAIIPEINDLNVIQNNLQEPLADNLYDDIVPVENINMDNVRLQNIRPPRFDSTKSNVRTFFTRFDRYRLAHNPPWNDHVTLNILSNLIDDSALDFYESLDNAVQNNYQLARDSFIEHYENGDPVPTQWSNLTSRKQSETESVTNYYDDLLKMARRMQIPADQLLCIFIEGLPHDTKTHLALNANPPVNLTQALTRAKTYQAVIKSGNPVKTLFKQIREENSPVSTAVENKNLESSINKLVEKLDQMNCFYASMAHGPQNVEQQNIPNVPFIPPNYDFYGQQQNPHFYPRYPNNSNSNSYEYR